MVFIPDDAHLFVAQPRHARLTSSPATALSREQVSKNKNQNHAGSAVRNPQDKGPLKVAFLIDVSVCTQDSPSSSSYPQTRPLGEWQTSRYPRMKAPFGLRSEHHNHSSDNDPLAANSENDNTPANHQLEPRASTSLRTRAKKSSKLPFWSCSLQAVYAPRIADCTNGTSSG